MKLKTLLALALAGLAALESLQAAPIKIGYSDWPGWTAWQIAKEKGLFKKNGVDVELVWFPIYTDSLTALNTGKIDANCSAWCDVIPPLAEGVKLKVVLVNDNSAGNDAVIAKPGIKSIKDLKGKTVATELGTVEHFALLQALAKNGMTEKDVDFKNLAVPDAAAAFIAGKVDAAAVWQPWINQIQKEGKGTAIFTSKEIPGLIPDLLVFQAGFVAEHPQEVQKIVATWFDVLDFIRHHEKEAVAIMAKVVEQKPEDYLAFMPGTKFFDLDANLHAFENRPDDASLAGSGKKIADFLKSIDMIKSVPDYQGALDPTFVKALKK
ncbi:MAG: ABC transporter substrate-binding protein [Verrucomicrobiota bacterium]